MYIASACDEVKFHRFPDGNLAHHYQPGGKDKGSVKSISWAKGGNWLALIPHTGHSEIISIKGQLKLIHTVLEVEQPTCSAFQHETKKLLGLGTKSGLALVYDIKARHVKKRFPRGSSAITQIAFTAKDSHVVASCINGEVLLYSNTSNNLSGTFRVPRSTTVSTIRTSAQKRHLVLGGSSEGVVVCWDINASKTKFTIDAHKAPVTSLAFSPVNSDLIISTGLDRQFNLYDIDSNKRIARIPVDNNITAVDFSADGLHFVVGSQNGKILVYDTRNIQQPSDVFDSFPNKAIKHLYIQPQSEHDSSICSNVTIKNSPLIKREEQNNVTNDSFGMFIDQGVHEPDTSVKCEGDSNGIGDSFLDALGIEQSKDESIKAANPPPVLQISDSVKKWLDSNKSIVIESPKNPNKLIHERLGLGDSKRLSFSTPISATQKQLETPGHRLSPVISKSNLDNNIAISSIRTMIQEEITKAQEKITQDIKYQIMSNASELRRVNLNLQMSMIKEFIKVENHCNAIKDSLNGNTMTHHELYLQEENALLRERVAQLEDELSSLTSSLSSKNSQC
ncbi:unnamed protein product [Brassicogethes aeneus]|uniref:Protein NEDD1 n=1 Tax=Brassicogethes aeneus TaxID=1431903 RepID=A0A9P0B0T3_BRAAE|nr:unnamed protein product [Brassicogethes aeneus]